jgi:hypothetical protein
MLGLRPEETPSHRKSTERSRKDWHGSCVVDGRHAIPNRVWRQNLHRSNERVLGLVGLDSCSSSRGGRRRRASALRTFGRQRRISTETRGRAVTQRHLAQSGSGGAELDSRTSSRYPIDACRVPRRLMANCDEWARGSCGSRRMGHVPSSPGCRRSGHWRGHGSQEGKSEEEGEGEV